MSKEQRALSSWVGSWIWKNPGYSEANLICFVHGYTGNATNTWGRFPHLLKQHGQGIGEHFDIASYGYESKLLFNSHGIKSHSEMLLGFLEHITKKTENLYLVTHSLGGIIARNLLLLTLDENAALFEKIKQVHFLATPHEGADLAPKQLRILRAVNLLGSELVKDSPELADILDDWRRAAAERSFKNKSNPLFFNYVSASDKLAVPEKIIEAFRHSNTEKVRQYPGNHISISKPLDEQNPVYVAVRDCILDDLHTQPSTSEECANKPESTKLTLASPPPAPSVYIGREEDLAYLKQKLGVNSPDNVTLNPSPMLSVCGYPGIGKTTTLIALANDPEVHRAYPDGVLWTSLGQQPDILNSVVRWGRALDLEGITSAGSIDEALNIVRAAIAHQQMLLVVDDYWEAAHAEPFRRLLSGKSRLLLSTRHRYAAAELAPEIHSTHTLAPLKTTCAAELFTKLCPNVPMRSEEVVVLVEDIECLPLSIHVAAGMIKNHHAAGLPFRDLIDEIRTGTSLLKKNAPADMVNINEATNSSISFLLHKSTDILDAETLECFIQLGTLSPKPAIFDIDMLSPEFWPTSKPNEVAADLVGRGLMESLGDGRFQMHALLVAHARLLMSE